MGSSIVPAPSAASKTQVRLSLLSGTSWTVPTGVTFVNVTLTGGGGGTGNVDCQTASNSGGTGGTTTFTGATSATGGLGGGSQGTGRGYVDFIGKAGKAGSANTGQPSAPATIYIDGGGITSSFFMTGQAGLAGSVATSTLTTTPGASITYAIGAGGTAGAVGSLGYAGAVGGSGRIDVEYWV
jgi:hypothetical protein